MRLAKRRSVVTINFNVSNVQVTKMWGEKRCDNEYVEEIYMSNYTCV